VTYGLRGVVSPLFAGTVEHTLISDVASLNSRSCENLLFFLGNTSQNMST
jgi:hypothetical protein